MNQKFKLMLRALAGMKKWGHWPHLKMDTSFLSVITSQDSPIRIGIKGKNMTVVEAKKNHLIGGGLHFGLAWEGKAKRLRVTALPSTIASLFGVGPLAPPFAHPVG